MFFKRHLQRYLKIIETTHSSDFQLVQHPDKNVRRVGDPRDDREGGDDLPPHAHVASNLNKNPFSQI